VQTRLAVYFLKENHLLREDIGIVRCLHQLFDVFIGDVAIASQWSARKFQSSKRMVIFFGYFPSSLI
jgi:hypothetical protein